MHEMYTNFETLGYHCRHNFCWVCLVPYASEVPHAEGFIHGRVNVAADPGNWAGDNLNINPINNLIRQARVRELRRRGIQMVWYPPRF